MFPRWTRSCGSAAAVAVFAVAVAAPLSVAASATPAPACSKNQQHQAKRCTDLSRRPATAPVQAPAASGDGTDGSGYSDPGRALGATSPSCRLALDGAARARCRASSSIARRHPLSSYGIDVRVGFSVTDPGKSLLGALQTLAAGAWTALVYLVDAMLLLLEWAYSLDLTAKTMPTVHDTLTRLHERAFGEPWLVAAISMTGLWGIWRGLVQRQHTQTMVGLLATLGLMICGLLVVSQPEQTVGRASALANEAGTSILAAATTGRPDHPRGALAESLAATFETLVRDPWCALEFGSLIYCNQPSGNTTNAETWLAYPAQSGERGELFHLVKGDEGGGFNPLKTVTALTPLGILDLGTHHKLPGAVRDRVEKAPERVTLQDAGGTFPRFALLAVIAIGVSGALALLGYLAVRLLLASLLTVLLLLFAPVMLLAPAFGDSGRQTFLAWAKRLVGAIAAKLLYSVFLAVVLAAARALSGVGIGWFGTWLLLAAFWWGVLIKRHELIGFVSAGMPHRETTSMRGALAQGYYAWQLGRGATALAAGAASGPAAVTGLVRERRGERQTARALAVGRLAREQLDGAAAHSIAAEQATAGRLVAEGRSAYRDLGSINRRLQRHDDAVVAARASGTEPPKATEEQQQLIAHRERLESVLGDAGMRRAEQIDRHAHTNAAQAGVPITHRDLDARRDGRRREHDELPLDHDRHLRAAGVDPGVYRSAPEEQRERFAQQVRDYIARERTLLDAAGERPTRSAVEQAVEHVRSDELRERTAAERQRLRDERRRRRGRTGIYR